MLYTKFPRVKITILKEVIFDDYFSPTSTVDLTSSPYNLPVVFLRFPGETEIRCQNLYMVNGFQTCWRITGFVLSSFKIIRTMDIQILSPKLLESMATVAGVISDISFKKEYYTTINIEVNTQTQH